MGICLSRYFPWVKRKSSTPGRVSQDVATKAGDNPPSESSCEPRSPSAELVADRAAILSLAESHGLSAADNTLARNPAEDDAQTAAPGTPSHPASPTRTVLWSLDQGSVVRAAIASLQAAQSPVPPARARVALVDPAFSPARTANTEIEAGPSPFSRVAARIRAIESTPSYGVSPSVRSPRLSLPDFLRAHEPGSGQGFCLFSDPGDGSALAQSSHVCPEQDMAGSTSAVQGAAAAGACVGLDNTLSILGLAACSDVDGAGLDLGLETAVRPAASAIHAYSNSKVARNYIVRPAVDYYRDYSTSNAASQVSDHDVSAAATAGAAAATANLLAGATDGVLKSDRPDVGMLVAVTDADSNITDRGLKPAVGGVAPAAVDGVMAVVDRVLEEIVDYINAVGAGPGVVCGFSDTAAVSGEVAASQMAGLRLGSEEDKLNEASGSDEQAPDDVLVKASGRLTLVCLDSSMVNAHDNSPKRQVGA